jgi:hypothetical protein
VCSFAEVVTTTTRCVSLAPGQRPARPPRINQRAAAAVPCVTFGRLVPRILPKNRSAHWLVRPFYRRQTRAREAAAVFLSRASHRSDVRSNLQ